MNAETQTEAVGVTVENTNAAVQTENVPLTTENTNAAVQTDAITIGDDAYLEELEVHEVFF